MSEPIKFEWTKQAARMRQAVKEYADTVGEPMKLDINELERKWAISNSRHHEPEAPCYRARGMKGCPCCDADEFLATQWDGVIAALREGDRLREEVTHLNESHADDLIEVASVLQLLDDLSQVWGDEGVFRRCRDRLRVLITPPPKE